MSLPPDTVIYLPSHPGPNDKVSLPTIPPLLPGEVGKGKRKRVKSEDVDDGAIAIDGEVTGEEGETPKRRSRISVLTHHEALTLFAHKGIYVDEATGELRSSANHKPCGKWDVHRYNRHFGMKVWKKYEAGPLQEETEMQRLMEAKERFFRMNPLVDESSLFAARRHTVNGTDKMLTVDELRVHEKHWMQMWKAARAELSQLRRDLRAETDEAVRAELRGDIEGLRRKKEDWSKLLGLDEPLPEDVA